MYGRVDGPMTEETPYNPCSRKGEVRARIARQLEERMKVGAPRGCIARAADFYGPHADRNAVPHILVLDKLAAGKRAQWLVDASLPHSLGFTLDSARGMAVLGERPEALGQVWHLPTADPPIDGKAFVELAAEELGVPPRLSLLKPWMIRLAGLFSSDIAETAEMLYQYERPYRFDSTKIARAFDLGPTPYAEGIRRTVAWIRQRAGSIATAVPSQK
jgi:nucleoside-diphosphate-sugar epimerase